MKQTRLIAVLIVLLAAASGYGLYEAGASQRSRPPNSPSPQTAQPRPSTPPPQAGKPQETAPPRTAPPQQQPSEGRTRPPGIRPPARPNVVRHHRDRDRDTLVILATAASLFPIPVRLGRLVWLPVVSVHVPLGLGLSASA